jgi:hypothetical protein
VLDLGQVFKNFKLSYNTDDERPMLSTPLKFVFKLMLLGALPLFPLFADADGNGQQYVLIVSGGVDPQSNNLRYLENVRAMYSAAKSMNVDSSHIVVLYGSGNLKDTATTDQPQFASPPMGYGYGGYQVQPGSIGMYPTAVQPPNQTRQNQQAIDPSSAQVPVGQLQAPSQMGYSAYPAAPMSAMPVARSSDGGPNAVRLSTDYLFDGEKRTLNGAATLDSLKSQLYDLQSKMKPGDQLLVYVTDHGSQSDTGQSEVDLWNGQRMSANDFSDMLRDLPSGAKVKIVTNICYGGGLTSMTSKNVCVMANQRGNKTSLSQSIDLDRFGQAFPYALKKRVASEPGKHPTLRDAFDYATSLDNPGNEPQTSLDYFLDQNREAILNAAKATPEMPDIRDSFCKDGGVGKDFKSVILLLHDFDKINEKIGIPLTGISKDRMDLVKGRIETAVNSSKTSSLPRKMQMVAMQADDLKNSLHELNKNWGSSGFLVPREGVTPASRSRTG